MDLLIWSVYRIFHVHPSQKCLHVISILSLKLLMFSSGCLPSLSGSRTRARNAYISFQFSLSNCSFSAPAAFPPFPGPSSGAPKIRRPHVMLRFRVPEIIALGAVSYKEGWRPGRRLIRILSSLVASSDTTKFGGLGGVSY